MSDSLYADTQRAAQAKIEAAHTWGRVQRGSVNQSPTYPVAFRVCTRCGHSDVFAYAHGLTECKAVVTQARG
jgi:hypothetical protein